MPSMPDQPKRIPDANGYALVTGGGVRVGAHIVRRLAADGWKVAVLAHRSIDQARSLAEELKASGTTAWAIEADLGQADALPHVFGRIDGFCSILVNSAAAFRYDDVGTLSAASLDEAFGLMLRAPLLLSRYFRDQLPEGARGLIVNILDQKVFNLNPDYFSYTVMKCALESATRLMALALAPRVRVCGVAPGLSLRSGAQTEKGFRDSHAEAPLGFGSTPDDIAATVGFIVRTEPLTGHTIVVDGGQSLVKRDRDVMFSHEIAPG